VLLGRLVGRHSVRTAADQTAAAAKGIGDPDPCPVHRRCGGSAAPGRAGRWSVA